MANQPETATYDAGVLQWEVTTAVLGGVGGAANAPLLSLSNRTAYLKQHLDALEAGSYIPATVAPLASPALTGTPTAPTAAADTSTTQIATTAFVIGQASSTAPVMDGTATVGTSKKYARADHVHPIDTSRAPLASPALTGTPTAPTAAANTNTTQIASTAFVLGQASSTTPAANGTAAVGTGTTFARADHVHPRSIPRIGTVASGATITPTADTADQYNVTALAVAATIAAPSGTPTDGQKLIIRIKDNGTAFALTWTTTAGGYRVIGTTLPTTTTVSKTIYIGCIYNAADGYWDVVAVATQA